MDLCAKYNWLSYVKLFFFFLIKRFDFSRYPQPAKEEAASI